MRYFTFLILLIAVTSCQGDGSRPNLKDNPTPAAEASRLFIWEYRTSQSLHYDYAQTGEGYKKMAMDGDVESLALDVTAQLDIETDASGGSFLYFTPVEEAPEGGDAAVENRPILLGSMDTTGVINDHRWFFFQLLTALPRKALKVGESDSFPVETTQSIAGLPIVLRGTEEITLTEYKTIDGIPCAVLTANVKVADSDVSDLPNTKYRGSFLGQGTYHYDLENGRLIWVRFESTIQQEFAQKSDDDGQDKYQASESKLEVEMRFQPTTVTEG